MSEVIVGENEDLESALQRFNRMVQRDGILAEAKRREHFEKPSANAKMRMLVRLTSGGASEVGNWQGEWALGWAYSPQLSSAEAHYGSARDTAG